MRWLALLLGLLLGLGCGAVDSAHIERLFGNQCHYPEGEAVISMWDPAGVYPDLGGTRGLDRAGIAECEQDASFADGAQLKLVCEDGRPVDFCSVSGTCVDPSSGVKFWCEGEVTFR